MFSLLGWTPSLRRMLRGRVLHCGCSVGVYETRSGEVVQIVDARGPHCPLVAHVVDSVLTTAGLDDEHPPPARPQFPSATH